MGPRPCLPDRSPLALRVASRAGSGIQGLLQDGGARFAIGPAKDCSAQASDHLAGDGTLAEIARIKAWLCLMRNATRDSLDFAALADRLGEVAAAHVVATLDAYYADQVGPGGRRIAAQAARQLADPRPGDRSEVDLPAYRNLHARWQPWGAVADACRRVAVRVLDGLAEEA